MPYYEYICPIHGPFQSENRGDRHSCPTVLAYDVDRYDGSDVAIKCHRMAKRKFGFSFVAPMPEHYNPSVGRVISSDKQHREALKIATDESNERLNLNQNFVPVDMNDKEALGVTDEGLDATRKQLVDSGEVERKLYL